MIRRHCDAHYLRRLHNLAVDLGWLAWPILVKRAWPKIRSQQKRAITAEEQRAVIASEKNGERRAYYELLYETGASQTDAANLRAENIDPLDGVLVYRRQKLGTLSEPARLTIGKTLCRLLQSLPQSGYLFPRIQLESAQDRSAEFADVAESLAYLESACIRTATHGHNAPRRVDIRNGSPKQPWATAAERYTKPTPEALRSFVQRWTSTKMYLRPASAL